MDRLGNCAIITEISSVMVHNRQAASNAGISNWQASASKNFMRLIEARLQAVSSRNIYSEQGLDALMRPPSGQVCHSLIVVSNCTPGSAHIQDASLMRRHKSRALSVLIGLPVVRAMRSQSASRSTESRKSLVRRTELLEFCPATVWYASDVQLVSYSSNSISFTSC